MVSVLSYIMLSLSQKKIKIGENYMDFNNADYLNKFFTISLIILAPFIIYAEVSKVTDCKNRWKLAQEILDHSQ